MLGFAAVLALIPVACPWATYPLPKGADMRLGDPSFFHGPDLLGLAFSPDGSKIATANSRSVIVRCAVTGRRLAEFALENSLAAQFEMTLLFSPDATRLLAMRRMPDHSTRVVHLDLTTRAVVEMPVGMWGGGKYFFSKDGTVGVLLSIGTTDVETRKTTYTHELRTFDAKTGRQLGTKPLPNWSMAVSHAGDVVALIDEKWRYRLFDLTTGKTVGTPEETPREAAISAFNASVTRVARKASGRVSVTDLTTGKTLFETALGDEFLWSQKAKPWGENDARYIVTHALSPDGGELAVAFSIGLDFDQSVLVRRWRVSDGKEVPPLIDGRLVTSPRVHYSPDGKTIATDSRRGDILFWDRATGKLRPTAFRPEVISVVDARRLLTHDGDRLRWHDAETGRVEKDVPFAQPGAVSVAVSADGRKVAFADRARFAVTDLGSGKTLFEVPAPNRMYGSVSPRVVFAAADAEVLFLTRGWDSNSAERREVPSGKQIWQTDNSPRGADATDGNTLYTTTEDRLAARDLATDRELWSVPLARYGQRFGLQANFVALFPDGRRIAVGRVGGLDLFDTDGKGIGRIKIDQPEPESDITKRGRTTLTRPVFSANGRWLAVAHDRDFLGSEARSPWRWDIWELTTGTRVMSVESPPKKFHTPFAFSPSGRYLWTNEPNNFPLRFDLKPPKSVCFDRARMWAGLGSSDAGVAYAAAGRAIDGTQWAEMGKRFPPERAADAKAVNELLAKLSSREFKEREGSSAELVNLGSGTLPALREFLKAPPSEEARRRAEKALKALTDETSPAVLARARLVSAVTMAATDDPAAREQLRAWAKGDAGLTLTDAARAALARLPK